MALHDSYARVTPFELAFPDLDRAEELAEAVAEEAAARGVSADDPAGFINLGVVGSFLQTLKGPEAAPEAIHDYALLVYHAVHFQRAGRTLLLVSTHVARYLTGGSLGDEAPPLPAPAGYVQLPRHLFWVDGGDEDPAEPVDGFFWTLDGRGLLHVLLATGIRDDRPGLAAVPLPEAPWADAGSWLDADVRARSELLTGDDFETTLPGGQIETLYSFTAAGEVLKLAARVFAYVHRYPRSVWTANGDVAPPEERAHGEPVPTKLPYRKVVLDDA